MSDSDQARAVIQEYVAACNAGSVERLKAIFHPDALMSGYLMGNFLMGSPEPFFQMVQTQLAPEKSGADYQSKITDIAVAGTVASVTLKETGYMGMNFTDYFHLARVDGKWQIISKTFNQDG